MSAMRSMSVFQMLYLVGFLATTGAILYVQHSYKLQIVFITALLVSTFGICLPLFSLGLYSLFLSAAKELHLQKLKDIVQVRVAKKIRAVDITTGS